MAELAGLPTPHVPQHIDGLTLVPVLRDPARPLRDHAYHCYPRDQRLGRAIRTERYRLVDYDAAKDAIERNDKENFRARC